jgi:WD40 repeat protein
METLECVRVLQGHNEAVLALAVGPTFLVSGSYDTTVRFWALDTLRCVRSVRASMVHYLKCNGLYGEARCSALCTFVSSSPIVLPSLSVWLSVGQYLRQAELVCIQEV